MTFVPMWIATPPTSAARNSGQLKAPSIAAIAPPAATGTTDAVKLNGLTISYAPVSLRQTLSLVRRR